MAGIKDFLFGKGALEKAAKTGDQSKSAPSTPAPVSVGTSQSDIAAMAQKQADRAKAQSKSPLSSPMTPVSKKGK